MNAAATSIASWLAWCAFPSCPNCVRIAIGADAGRVHCAEHATIAEVGRFYALPVFQLDAALSQPKRRLGWRLIG
jgi:hypothetical protein